MLLLRIKGTLRGLGSCLPDFRSQSNAMKGVAGHLTVVGAAGATIGTSELRKVTAEILHEVCR